MISLYLEDTLIKDTPDFKDIEEVIEMDMELKAWIHKFGDLKLTFYGDGYNYIKALKKQYGYNYRIEFTIVVSPDDGSVGEGDVIKGYIYLTDVEFEHTKLSVTAPLIEVFFEGTIKQNQKSLIYFDGLQKTLNGLTLDDVPVEDSVEMFKPLDGSALFNVDGIELVSAIQSAIGYITDNGVTFQDNYFGATFGKYKYLLVNGNQLRTQDTSLTKIKTAESFQNLMEQVFKLFNVWWYIDYSTIKPTFIIDHYDAIVATTGGITMPFVKNMRESFNEESFYTSLRIGSEKTQRPPFLVYTEYLQFINGYTHHEESYSAKNNTMIENEFNLVTNWIIDHNILQHLLVDSPNDPQYDEFNFLIQYDNVLAQATPFTFANIEADTRRLYNEGLTNVKRLDRFTLPIELGFDLGITNNNFEANISTDTVYSAVTAVAITTLPCDAEILDPNNNYNNATFRYTCPATIIGYYAFEAWIQCIFSGIPAPTVTVPYPCVRIQMTLFNKYASGTTKQSKIQSLYITHNSGSEGEQQKVFENFFLNVGDYVYATYSMQSGQLIGGINFFASPTFNFDLQIVGAESVFKTAFVQNQGGTILTSSEIRNYHGGLINYEHNIDQSTWKTLKRNSIQSIVCTTQDGRMAETKIKNIKRNIKTGKTTLELLTKEGKVGL